jgi:hypothetical protein
VSRSCPGWRLPAASCSGRTAPTAHLPGLGPLLGSGGAGSILRVVKERVERMVFTESLMRSMLIC